MSAKRCLSLEKRHGFHVLHLAMIKMGVWTSRSWQWNWADLCQERRGKVYHWLLVVCSPCRWHCGDRTRQTSCGSFWCQRSCYDLYLCTVWLSVSGGRGKPASATAFLPGNCRRAGKEVIKTLFNELSVILPQSKNNQTSSLWDAFAYTLAILYYENFKNAYRSEQGYIKKMCWLKIFFSIWIIIIAKKSLWNSYRKISCQRQLYLPWIYQRVSHFPY